MNKYEYVSKTSIDEDIGLFIKVAEEKIDYCRRKHEAELSVLSSYTTLIHEYMIITEDSRLRFLKSNGKDVSEDWKKFAHYRFLKFLELLNGFIEQLLQSKAFYTLGVCESWEIRTSIQEEYFYVLDKLAIMLKYLREEDEEKTNKN